MNKRGIYPKLTVDYILARIAPEDIMGFYTGIPVIDRYFTGNTFCNPFRKDTTPTCNYYYSPVDGKLRMRDYSGRSYGQEDRMFNADIFDVVALRHELRTDEKQSFKLILNIIAKDFKIHVYEDPNEIVQFDKFLKNQTSFKKKIKIFKVVPRKWNGADGYYWHTKYGITSAMLNKHKVIPVQELWVEDNKGFLNRTYVYRNNDPAYAYYGGVENGINLWKVYFPFRRHSSQSKTLTNKSFMEGLDTLVPAPIGLITKSKKDVMALDMFNIQSASLASESTPPTPDQVFMLKKTFDFLFSLLDFDRAGIRMAKFLKKHYGIEPLMFTRGWYGSVDYGVKDFSDFREAYGFDKTIEVIKTAFDYYEDCFEYSNKLIYNKWEIF